VRALTKQKRALAVGVAGTRKVTDDFVKAWKRAERGLPPEEPINRLHFADTATLFRYLSPKRFELLQYLRKGGPLSIRKLASGLRRDYKNVHTDVKELLHVGLIEESDEELLSVPWDVIVSELPLVAKTKAV
jgi:predicted transcriptional regulator